MTEAHKSALKKDTPDQKKKEAHAQFGAPEAPEKEIKEGKSEKAKIDVPAFVATLVKSIPAKVMSDIKGWMVEQAAITKAAMPPSTPDKPEDKRKNSLTNKLSRMGTSKIHKFKPAVSVQQAFEWLASFGAADSSLIFNNQCMLIIEGGVYCEFEDLRDDAEADEDGAAGDADKRPPDSDDEAETD